MSTTSPSTLPGLYCELHWGQELAEARAFGPELEAVRAAPDEAAPMPLYGFGVADGGETLAQRTATGYRVYPPPGVLFLFRKEGRGKDEPLETSTLPREGSRTYVDLTAGQTLTLSIPERDLRLLIRTSVVRQRVGSDARRNMVGLVLAVVATIGFPLAFLTVQPNVEKMAAFNARAMEAARVREAVERKALDAKYPSYVDVDGGVVTPENGITLPTSLSVH